MPVSVGKKGDKWRIVEDDGEIAKNKGGTAVDGGGHESKNEVLKQMRAINANR